jgi:SAM-dependent methyltransferase
MDDGASRKTVSDDLERSEYQTIRRAHWGEIAKAAKQRRGWSHYYHRRLAQIYAFLVGTGRRVLELGCGDGNLLAGLNPQRGCGIDFSPEMIALARRKHLGLEFVVADAHDFTAGETFEFIILSDLVNDLWDVQTVLESLRAACSLKTRVILNFYSRIWELPLKAAARLGLARPMLQQNWLTPNDVRNLLELAGYETIRTWQEILLPLPLGPLSTLFNRFLVKLWPLRVFGLTNFVVARPVPVAGQLPALPRISVIVPARNEEGNIRRIIERMPEPLRQPEVIFVEGHSADRTSEAIRSEIEAHPDWNIRMIRQDGVGKGDAVKQGFSQATGDILMILDADMTVAPEDLPRFAAALMSGKAELVNGVRLVYPMGEKAMRLVNLVGNKAFGLTFSWLLGQPIKDTLCGTKALWREDYEKIAGNRAYFGDFDPFGDFDLIFGAAKLNLKIMDLPVRYRERTYGQTNIRRWKHGWLLIRMIFFASSRIKFV